MACVAAVAVAVAVLATAAEPARHSGKRLLQQLVPTVEPQPWCLLQLVCVEANCASATAAQPSQILLRMGARCAICTVPQGRQVKANTATAKSSFAKPNTAKADNLLVKTHAFKLPVYLSYHPTCDGTNQLRVHIPSSHKRKPQEATMIIILTSAAILLQRETQQLAASKLHR